MKRNCLEVAAALWVNGSGLTELRHDVNANAEKVLEVDSRTVAMMMTVRKVKMHAIASTVRRVLPDRYRVRKVQQLQRLQRLEWLGRVGL